MIDLETIDADLKDKFIKVRLECAKHGIEVDAVRGHINLFEHAEHWRQSRTDCKIDAEIGDLRALNCAFLADVLESANGNLGRSAIKLLPGFCWHNWGQAVDVVLYDKRRKRILEGEPDFEMFLKIIRENGFELDDKNCGFNGKHIHLQLEEGLPEDSMSCEEINDAMNKRYQDGD